MGNNRNYNQNDSKSNRHHYNGNSRKYNERYHRRYDRYGNSDRRSPYKRSKGHYNNWRSRQEEQQIRARQALNVLKTIGTSAWVRNGFQAGSDNCNIHSFQRHIRNEIPRNEAKNTHSQSRVEKDKYDEREKSSAPVGDESNTLKEKLSAGYLNSQNHIEANPNLNLKTETNSNACEISNNQINNFSVNIKVEPNFQNTEVESSNSLEQQYFLPNISDFDNIQIKTEKNNVPQLTTVLLSRLLQEEPNDLVLENHFEELKNKFQANKNNKILTEVHTLQSNASNECEKVVTRVATMDKNCIKNVINNPDPKFDAALKLKARKKLREEIRKKLRQFNLNINTEENNDNNFEPDEFVESGQIPEVIWDEIRKTFGAEFLREAGVSTRIEGNVEQRQYDIFPHGTKNESNLNLIKSPHKINFDKPKTDLMTRLKNFEFIKSNRTSNNPKSPPKKERTPTKAAPAEIVSILSSSESSNSSENSNSSDSSSASSSSSNSPDDCNDRAKQLEKRRRALEESVVNSFRTTILPKLTFLQRQRFEEKSSSGMFQALMFIYDICNKKIKKKLSIGYAEQKHLRNNLKSSNNEDALQFLMKNIKDLFEQDKKASRDSTKRGQSRESAYKSNKKGHAKEAKNNNIKIPDKYSEVNLEIASNAANEIAKIKPSNENHPPDQYSSISPQEAQFIKEKPPLTIKSAQSAVEDYCGTAATGVSSTYCDASVKDCGSSVQGNEVVPSNAQSPRYSLNNIEDKDFMCEINKSDNSSKNPESLPISSSYAMNGVDAEHDSRPRSWKSPGEKKCLEPLSPQHHSSAEDSVSTTPLNASRESNFSHLDDVGLVNMFDMNEADNLRILSLIQQNKISDTVLNGIREIDSKLMQMQNRKMKIEEMILNLQKEKMAIDMNTMQLQNQKLIIISTVATQNNPMLAQNSMYPPMFVSDPCDIGLSLQVGKKHNKTKNTIQRPRFSTPFGQKLINRKKRCQRDILLEDTANSLQNDDAVLTNIIRNSSPDEITENVDDLFQRKKRKVTIQNSSGSNCEKEKSSHNQHKESHSKRTSDQNIREVPEKSETVAQKECSLDGKESDTDLKSGCAEVEPDIDVPSGDFYGFKMPISHVAVSGEFVVAASEDGTVYKFSWKTKKLLAKFTKHTEAVTRIFIDHNNYVYTTSLDGFLKKTSIENFGLEMQSINLQEPLQTIEIQWNIAYIGSRWGNVFSYKIMQNTLSETLLCSVGSSIMALKAAKEGARQILIISSKGNQINLRDAISGLLLRTIDVPENKSFYSILLDENILYCGSNRNEIFTFEFSSGNRMAVLSCGNGVTSIKLFRKNLIFAGCYDGFIYVINKKTGCRIGRFPGCGKVILAMDIIGNKLLTSSKDNFLQLMDIPKYILAIKK